MTIFGKKISALVLIFLAISTSISAMPQPVQAATTCPTGSGWTTGRGLLTTPRQTNCYFNGQFVGMADMDATAIQCPSGSTSIFTGGVGGTASAGQSCVSNSNGQRVTPSGTNAQRPNTDIPACSGVTAGWFSPECWGIWLTVLFGSGIVSMLSLLPWFADQLLEFVVQYTVVLTGFNKLYSGISPAVELGWSFVRDFANIAIIGVFVFIAIGIILGLKEYGQKKLIAKVLIISILINFSFLFTRIVINFSNALSTNFYSRLIVNPAGNNVGIGGNLLHTLRITTAENSGNTWNAFVSTSKFGFSSLLMHIVVSSLVAVLSAIALLYISFLLLARFIVLIFLLISSSAAFAAFLLPSTTWFWSKWWSMLFKNALIAPILFIALSLALNMSIQISKVLCDPNNANACSASALSGKYSDSGPGIAFLFNYLIVLGIIFAGITIANSFSLAISRRIATNLTAAPFTLGARLGTWPVRGIMGRSQLARKGQLGADAEAARIEAAKQRLIMNDTRADDSARAAAKREYERHTANAAKLTRQADKAGARAGRTFNPADLGGVQKMLKAAGVVGALSGTTSKGSSIADQVKVRAEAAAKTPGASDKEKVAAETAAKERVAEQRKLGEQQLKTASEAKKANEALVKKMHETAMASKDAKGKEAAAVAAAATATGAEKKVADDQSRAAKEAARQAHEKLLAEMQKNPELARQFPGLENGVTADLDRALREAAQESRKADEALESHIKATPGVIERLGKALAAEATSAVHNDVAVGVSRGGVVQHAKDALTGDDAFVSKEVLSKLKKSRNASAQIANFLKEAEGPAAATAEPEKH